MSRTIVPIAARYLERILFDSPPSEAIEMLSSIWQVRAKPEERNFGLSEPEYRVQLCLVYTGEIGNGGHAQFLMNRGGRFVPDTIKALAVTGLSDLAAVLEKAVSGFPGKTVPADPAETERALRLISAADGHTLVELDKTAFSLLPSVDARLLSYVRANKAQVLLPETPSDLRVGRCLA